MCVKFGAYLAVFYHIFNILSVIFYVIVYIVVGINLYKHILCVIIVMYVPFWLICFIVLFCALFVCKCVFYSCSQVSPQLQLTNLSCHIISIELLAFVNDLILSACLWHLGRDKVQQNRVPVISLESSSMKSFCYPLERMPDLSHCRWAIFGEQKNSLSIMRIGPQFLGCPARRLDTVLTELPGSTIILAIIFPIINFSTSKDLQARNKNIYTNTVLYKHYQFTSSVYSTETPVEGIRMFVPTC